MIQRRKIILAALSLIFIMFLIYGFGHSIIIVSSDSAGTGKINARFSGASETKTELLVGDSKVMLVKSGRYDIEASSGDKKTLINTSARPFWINSVKLDFRERQPLAMLGVGSEKCSLDTMTSGNVYYFNCVDPVAPKALSTNDGKTITELPVPAEARSERTFARAMPYLGGLSFVYQTTSGAKFFASGDPKAVLVLPNINLNGAGRLLATDTNNSGNSRLALLAGNTLHIYDGIADTQPEKLDLSKYYGDSEHLHDIVTLYNNEIYIYSSLGRSSEQDGNVQTDSFLLKIDATNTSDTQQFGLNKSLSFVDVVAGESPILVERVPGEGDLTRVHIFQESKLEPLGLPQDVGDDVCYTDADSLYFVANDTDLYKYDFSKGTSYFIYGSNPNGINNIQSAFGQCNITVNLSRDSSDYVYFSSAAPPGQENNLQTVLPIGSDSINDIRRAYAFRNDVFVRLINKAAYENRNNPNYRPTAANQTEDEERVLDSLAKKGVRIDQYKFIFSY